MKKLVCILNILFIYLVMFLPLFIFFGSKVSLFEAIWVNIFRNNVFIPIGLLLILCIITFILNIIFCIKNINNDIDIKDLTKSNMIVKLIQIPAYIIIFLIGIICLMTIFTFAISIVLAILDFVSLVMTGIYAITCYKKMKDYNIITNQEFIIYSLLSFVYCTDLIVSIIAYKKCKDY